MILSHLDQLKIVLRSGDESFRGDGASLQLVDYWRWSGSSLMDNTARGMLAEFLVATALGRHQIPRVEWDRYDLRTPSGVTIEVKSAARIQSWKQKAPTPLEFTIGRRLGWDPETAQYSKEARRWADLYVFCVLEDADPLNVDKWQFYVLPSAVLDEKCGAQQTIRLKPLLRKLSPRLCCYQHLKCTIEKVGLSVRCDPGPDR